MLSLDRRSLITGAGATLGVGLGTVASAAAQELEPDFDSRPIQLLANLFTRVGAEIFLNGRGPFTFVIDTGAVATSVSDHLADRLQLQPTPPVMVHSITESRMTRSVAVNRLRLNHFGFNNLTCPVFQHDQLGADGLIGLDILGRFSLRFDVVRRSALLSRPGLSVDIGLNNRTGSRLHREGLRAVPGRFGQLMLTQVLVDGQSTVGFIDSGAQYSIGNQALRREVAARRRDGWRASRTVSIYGVTGRSVSAELSGIQDLRLGSSRLGATPMLFADLHCFEVLGLAERPALLIGADLLGRFREVTLNFPADMVSFSGLRRQTTRTLEVLRS